MRFFAPIVSGTIATLPILLGNNLMPDNFEMVRSTIDGGRAMPSAGGEFELSGTIG